jgi:hypothetical protein
MENNRLLRRTASRWTARPTLELPSAIAGREIITGPLSRPQGDGPSARLNRRARVSTLIVGAAAIVLLASVSTSAHAAEDSTRIMHEHHACAAVLGFDPSERRYDACIRSLDRTASLSERSGLAASNRSLCAQQGLNPGTSAFAICVVKAEQFPSGSGRNGAVVPAP